MKVKLYIIEYSIGGVPAVYAGRPDSSSKGYLNTAVRGNVQDYYFMSKAQAEAEVVFLNDLKEVLTEDNCKLTSIQIVAVTQEYSTGGEDD